RKNGFAGGEGPPRRGRLAAGVVAAADRSTPGRTRRASGRSEPDRRRRRLAVGSRSQAASASCGRRLQAVKESITVKKLILLFAFVLGVQPAIAQEKPTAPVEAPQATADAQIPLRVQLVVSRYQGEKKISSIPYTLSVVANGRDSTSVRMGIQVPVPTTVPKAGAEGFPPMTSYNYRTVGTNIDCTARTIDAGVFRLDLTVEDTSVFVPEKEGPVASG